MRILHVYKDYAPVVGGIENHVRWLAESQAAVGCDVSVLACSPSWRTTREHRHGVRVVLASRLVTAFSMPISLSLPRLLRRERPDVVHYHVPFPLGLASSPLCSRDAARVVTYHSDIVRQRVLGAAWEPLQLRLLRNFDAVIATSPSYARKSSVLSRLWRPPDIVPLGIPVELNRTSPDLTETRARNRILFVGCLRHYKGLDILLLALKKIPSASLTVVGDGPMRREWESLAHQLGLGDRVSFVGRIEQQELLRHYNRAGVFVLPSTSRAEAFGTVLLEAMSHELPVVSTDLGTGTSWVNENGKTGFVVPAGNEAALAAAVESLVSNPDLSRRMGRAGRERTEALFTVERMRIDIHRIYECVIASLTRKSRNRTGPD